MNIEIKDHFLYIDGIRVPYHDSPNDGGIIKHRWAIAHYTTSQSVEGTISWFMNKDSDVSAHLLIGRDGKVYQFVPFDMKAWHAGLSEWMGVSGLNGFSIGIEFANAGLLQKKGNEYFNLRGTEKITDVAVINGQAWQKYTDKQMEAGRAIWIALKKHYKLEDIIAHSDISPTRKIDVGAAFDWAKIKGESEKGSVQITDTTLNIRTLPNTTESKLVDYPLVKGTEVEIITSVEGWSFVKVPSRCISGWVASRYLV